MSVGLPHEAWISLRDAVRSTSAGSSIFPRHKRRSRYRRGYINRFLVFRKTPEVRDEIGKGREESQAFFQWLGGTFRCGNKSAELLQGPCLGIELVQPQARGRRPPASGPAAVSIVHLRSWLASWDRRGRRLWGRPYEARCRGIRSLFHRQHAVLLRSSTRVRPGESVLG